MSDLSKRASIGGALLIALGAALWGTDAVLRVPLTQRMGATSIVLDEHLILSLYAIPSVLLSLGPLRKLRGSQWLALIAISWGGSGLATVLFTEAFATGNPTTVILLQKMQPLFAILLARLMLRESLGWRYWPWFVTAMAGAYLVSFDNLTPFWTLSQATVLSAVLAIAAAALWGSATVFGRFVLADLPFPTVTGARFLLAVPFLLGLAFVQGQAGGAVVGLGAFTVNLVLLALIPGLISLLIYYRGLSSTHASIATLAELAFPASAIVLNWLFLKQGVSAGQVAGFAIVWLSIVALDRFVSPLPDTAAGAPSVSVPA
ncbi:MAG: DMT family transporter [Candidatus Limnocylindrales bacterium]